MNLLLHGVEDFKIIRGDTLREPGVLHRIAPVAVRLRDRQPAVLAGRTGAIRRGRRDRWGRNKLGGVAPKGYADWAWVQHMITSAGPRTGRVAVVLPQGALFRQGAEGRIRQSILRADLHRGRHRARPEPLLRDRAWPPAC